LLFWRRQRKEKVQTLKKFLKSLMFQEKLWVFSMNKQDFNEVYLLLFQIVKQKLYLQQKKHRLHARTWLVSFFDDAKIWKRKWENWSSQQEIKKKTDAKDAKLIKVNLQPKWVWVKKAKFYPTKEKLRFSARNSQKKLESIKQI